MLKVGICPPLKIPCQVLKRSDVTVDKESWIRNKSVKWSRNLNFFKKNQNITLLEFIDFIQLQHVYIRSNKSVIKRNLKLFCQNQI